MQLHEKPNRLLSVNQGQKSEVRGPNSRSLASDLRSQTSDLRHCVICAPQILWGGKAIERTRGQEGITIFAKMVGFD